MNGYALPLVYLAVFAAVFMGVEAIYLYQRDVRGARKRVNERLDLLARGVAREEVMARLRRSGAAGTGNRLVANIANRLHRAGIRISPRRFLAGMTSAALLIALGFPAFAGLYGRFPTMPTLVLVGLLAGALGFGLPLTVVSMTGARRLKKFEQQFPIGLDIFVRGLRAGHPVSAALDLLTTELPDPIGSEFGLVTDEVNYGLTLKQALENLAIRVPTQDMQMFVVCVGIQSETGGNLAEILEGLSKVIRERASMVLKVRALASEGKMSGVMLSILPMFTFCLVFSNAPSFYLDVAGDPIFMPALIGIICWYAIGVFSMNRLTKLKV